MKRTNTMPQQWLLLGIVVVGIVMYALFSATPTEMQGPTATPITKTTGEIMREQATADALKTAQPEATPREQPRPGQRPRPGSQNPASPPVSSTGEIGSVEQFAFVVASVAVIVMVMAAVLRGELVR